MNLTLTQNIFACCLGLFGPLYAFWGAYVCRSNRLGPIWGFLLSGFAAYAGWFVSGMVALNMYPNYAYGEPPETTAVLFAIPGFLTGLLGVLLVRKFGAQK